jgi:hypothetical protein
VAAADVARRSHGIQQALGLSNEDLERSGEQERRSIGTSQESRGVFKSGETLRRQGEQEERQARQRSGLELAASSGLGDLQSGLQSAIAGRSLQGAELGLSTAGNAYAQSGEEEIAKKRLGY